MPAASVTAPPATPKNPAMALAVAPTIQNLTLAHLQQHRLRNPKQQLLPMLLPTLLPTLPRSLPLRPLLSPPRGALAELRKILIPQSVEDVIASADPAQAAPSVVFVPHQALHLIPFAALLNPAGNPLLASCDVTCVPSLHALQTCMERHQRQTGQLVTSAGEGPESSATNATSTSAAIPTATALVIGNPSPMPAGLGDLPGAAQEAQDVAARIGLSTTKVLVGPDALAHTIVSTLIHDKPNIVHFATHGVQDPITELENAGLLPRDQAKELRATRSWHLKGGLACTTPAFDHRPEDDANDPDFKHTAFLNAHRIGELDLSHGGLAVLSACNSHRGHFGDLPANTLGVPQDGTAGLSLAFLRAGLPRAVVTLWPISDWATSYIRRPFTTTSFWMAAMALESAHPFPPLHVSRCLRLAILDLWQHNPDLRHDPFFWAAFVVYGLP
eukprot:m.432630 g.432630  ORF g.432630 m.432630 type:complete len:444 (+) comp20246_c1_seq3:761-2092(+)